MPLSVTSANKVYAPNSVDGYVVGVNSADVVGFYGVTPVDQAAAITAVTTTVTSTAAWAWTTSTAASAAITSINSALTALADIGIIAS